MPIQIRRGMPRKTLTRYCVYCNNKFGEDDPDVFRPLTASAQVTLWHDCAVADRWVELYAMKHRMETPHMYLEAE